MKLLGTGSVAALSLLVLSACSGGQETLNDASGMPYGRWAAEPDWCESSGEGSAIVLAEGRFEGRENVCEMDTAQSGEGAWTADLHCEGEGMASSERIAMAVDGNTMLLTYLDRDGASVQLARCP